MPGQKDDTEELERLREELGQLKLENYALVRSNTKLTDHIETILYACRSSLGRHVTEQDLMCILGDMYHD